ncbi:DUF6880 family protein [Amaricoccus solimangrovi]|uniref:Uncharacterized protein n=1 Tax=Amaricoccus solimangrovi TaxID=2589815 RepID=A0A501WJJ0_9RHOB|nr:DUF6880 family protein [Amaricoccus solimangrovi]TPE47307.1 hypothetical protein FJM51_20210 [Amaricoccus solimangrovi]
MSKKTLNAANLERLGAEKLAALVMELVAGNAALQRRARMELSAAQGPEDVASDIRKRFASLRRSSSFMDWHGQKALVKDLEGLVRLIEEVVAPHDTEAAFELLWSFLQLAPSIHERADDSNGAIGGVFDDVIEAVARLAPRLSVDPEAQAERILPAVADAGYGEFDGIIPAMAAALGRDGLEHLKRITNAWADAPPTEGEIARYRSYGLSSPAEEAVRRNKETTRSIILADVADAQGDVDAYMARYSAEQLTFGTIAPDVARRLLDAGRVDEAFDLITRARDAEKAGAGHFSFALDQILEECLERQGRTEELKRHLWLGFERTLGESSLRKYLRLLPDFEDIEAEERALGFAETFPHLGAAIALLINWPAYDRAAHMVMSRFNELDGNAYYTLTPAAAALDTRHPLAASLTRRAMIEDTLDGAKSKRYRHAARHLAECQANDRAIENYHEFATHSDFVAALRKRHARKHGFWQLVRD